MVYDIQRYGRQQHSMWSRRGSHFNLLIHQDHRALQDRHKSENCSANLSTKANVSRFNANAGTDYDPAKRCDEDEQRDSTPVHLQCYYQRLSLTESLDALCWPLAKRW